MAKPSAFVALAAVLISLPAFGQPAAPPAEASTYAVLIHEGKGCSFTPETPLILGLVAHLADRGYTVSSR